MHMGINLHIARPNNPPNLIVNGTDPTGITGWTVRNSAVLSVVSSEFRLTNGAASNGYAFQVVPTVIGRTYRLTGLIKPGTATSPRLGAGPQEFDTTLLTLSSTVEETKTGTFVATGTFTWITMVLNTVSSGAFASYNDITLR